MFFSNKAVIRNEWAKDRGRYLGQRIHGKVIGVCGFGNIGARYGEMMNRAFACKIICYDPFLSEEEVRNKGGEKVSFESLLAESDAISIHMNLTKDNQGIFNKNAFKQMKSSAVLINTARGGLVDENDIIEALDENIISGYAADVLNIEPPEADHPYLHHEKIILTPHIGAYNHECNEMMCESVVEDINRVMKGEEPAHLLLK